MMVMEPERLRTGQPFRKTEPLGNHALSKRGRENQDRGPVAGGNGLAFPEPDGGVVSTGQVGYFQAYQKYF